MKLLIITQAVDENDQFLGFFHGWIEALARRVESVEAICLTEGKHALPGNVRVHSLGKEQMGSRSAFVARASYVTGFFRLIWSLRRTYDAVFVHMNEEYVLLGALLWLMLGKRVYLWRNHYAGSSRTNLAARLSRKVFYTSKSSYTARFRNAVRMPVGVDTARFSPDGTSSHPRSILYLARIAPSKRPALLLDALALLSKRDIAFTADFYGPTLPKDAAYRASLEDRARALGLLGPVSFHPGVPNRETPAVYRGHCVFVNAAPSGMLDKTVYEALASGCIVLTSSEDFRDEAGEEYYFDSAPALADKLMRHLGKPAPDPRLPALSEKHSLDRLSQRLVEELHV